MSWVATGVTVGSTAFKIGGSILGKRSAKDRQRKLKKKIKALSNKIAQSVRLRLREADKLTKEQIKFAEEQMEVALDHYAEMKLKFAGIYERNSASANDNYREQLETIESQLQEELGIQAELFQEYNTGLDELYVEERDYIQADLAYNRGLKDEFKLDADKAIRDTWEASESAKIDLKQLKDSGGRPESFDREIASNAKAFGDIQKEIDRSDAGRGRSDLTGKKMTAMFAEAMNRGKITGDMAERGEREERALRGEVVGLGNTAMNQGLARLQGAEATEGRTMADLENRYGNARLNALMDEGMQRLSMTQNANDQEAMAQNLYQDAMAELQAMMDNGEISLEEFKFQQGQMWDKIKMGAREQNFAYKDSARKGHETAMQNQIASLTGQAQANEKNTQTDWGLIGNSIGGAVGTIGGLYADGAFSKITPQAKPAESVNPAVPSSGKDWMPNSLFNVVGGVTGARMQTPGYNPTPVARGVNIPNVPMTKLMGGMDGPRMRQTMPSMKSGYTPRKIDSPEYENRLRVEVMGTRMEPGGRFKPHSPGSTGAPPGFESLGGGLSGMYFNDAGDEWDPNSGRIRKNGQQWTHSLYNR